ncbi:MAG: PD-(D/E)XK nuclease family protein [Phormidesmis sp.]
MPSLPHYKAKQVSVNHKRHYEVNGSCYPGITTILSATKPYEDKKRLWDWQDRIGKAEARRITTTSARSGSRIHKTIKAYLKQEPYDMPAGIEGFWQSIEPVLLEIDEVLLVEGAVWHPLRFGGYPDAVMRYEGELCVCDWKTARRPKQIEWIEDYCMQVAAYCYAVNWVYRDTGIHIERGVIAIALEDYPAQVFTLQADDLFYYWRSFQKRLKQYYQQQARG